MDFESFLKNKKVVVTDKAITGDGFLEESAIVNGRLNLRFFVGAYSIIEHTAFCQNAFIGRFSIIEKNSHVGYPVVRGGSFSNHYFAKAQSIPVADEYYKKIKTNRFYYEQGKYTIIGSDVVVGRGSTIQEGVVVGDGAIIYPGSFVVADVEPFSIVAGNPATVVGYRFDKETVGKLVASKWWKYDISSAIPAGRFGYNDVDYVDNHDFIERVCAGNFPVLAKTVFWINTFKNIAQVNDAKKMIVGPSHIDRWYQSYLKGEVNKPERYHLLPIPALSLFSDQLKTLISWWQDWFEDVLLFVPDFRIGNVAVDRVSKDGRFIRQDIVSEENSRKCFSLGMESLSYFSDKGGVRFWFWCLFGREEFNKGRGQYLVADGSYQHPIWNYSEMLEKFPLESIDIKSYFPNILEMIVDGSIHPTLECYQQMCKVFDES